MTKRDEIASAERALEQLFRMSSSRRLHDRQLAQVGADVSRPGYAILRCVSDGEDHTLLNISRACLMDPGATSRQIRQLESDGFVAKGTSKADGREIAVHITKRGAQIYERVVAMRTGYLGVVLDKWTSADRLALSRLVARLVEDMHHVPLDAPSAPGR